MNVLGRLLFLMREDVATVVARDPSIRSPLEALCHPALPAIWLHRIAHRLARQGHRIGPRLLSNVAKILTGVEIHPGARIGRRFFIDHGQGVVIGETAVIGDDVTLYQQVTLGALGFWRDNARPPGEGRHPVIGDRVVIGAKATVLGPVRIGDDVVVPAHSLVLDPIPTGQRPHANSTRSTFMGDVMSSELTEHNAGARNGKARLSATSRQLMESIRLSQEELLARVARFDELVGTDGGAPDTALAQCARVMYNVIGFRPPERRGANDEQIISPIGSKSSGNAPIDIAEGFNLAFIKTRPGNGTILHNHDTNETFIPLSGRWRFRCNDEDDLYVDLGPLDTISLPAGLQRRFTNLASDTGEDTESLMLVIVAGDRPKSVIYPEVLDAARKEGAYTPAAHA
ncbi:serine O-acetyltransferase EpsC [Goodfellowiella coeruleoviolacea]|uniref:serine O-acetyltransferase n=1 Tax=Goodfellowiella coeruleoviolacea TaxID=334858 RepID=A0AAE3G9N3_9PSEU|nr:serine O-acetyltransferase EpsC [Goodfellowiella coeruleoviolacea]MCP2163302.1 serine O-acetyltransferase [Goodfellowiella coeruleoviolacea]